MNCCCDLLNVVQIRVHARFSGCSVRQFPCYRPSDRSFTISIFSLILTLLMLVLPARAWAQTAHFSYAQSTLGNSFSNPFGVAVDGIGNVFVADTDNSALKEILAAGGYTTVTTLGSGFSNPRAIAVDGSGNVFVAYGNAVKEILAVGGIIPSSPTINTLGSGFSGPDGVAVDGNGNVFVVDSGNNAVKEILAAGGYTTVKTLGSGFSNPFGVAVDGSGNVFVADWGNNAVKEILAVGGIIPSSPTINTLGSGFLYPHGIAVDGSGNVFVTDYNGLKEILAAGGYTTVNALGSNLNQSFGVAVDSIGNIYVADTYNTDVVKLGTGAVDFGTVNIGQTSATIPLTFTFDSGGTIGSPVALTQGAAGLDFAVASGGSCVAGTYSAGETCTVNVTFTPKFAGPRKGAVVLNDGSGNTIATGYIHGLGSGPQVSFLPGSQLTLGGGFDNPAGIAVDGSGNVFVAEYNDNVVKEVPFGCTSASCVKTLASGFSSPNGMAVDGSGNVFVANGGGEGGPGGAVYEVPSGCNTSSCIKTLGGGFSSPMGIAVDSSGNIFVADGGNGVNQSVYEILAAGGYATVKTLASGLHAPDGIAVDGNGDVFIADSNNAADYPNNVVYELPSGCVSTSCMITLGTGFSGPTAIAVDASGNVFVADTLNNAVKEILAAGGYTTINTLGSGFNYPSGLAVDGSGNIFVGDLLNSRVVKLDLADSPSLSFGSINVGANSAEQTVTLQNIGNAPLTLPLLPAGSNPSVSQNFALDSSASTACPIITTSAAGSLAPGASCTLSIGFAPIVSGSINGSVVLTDNALNAASPNYTTQTIALQGIGSGVVTSVTTTMLSVPSSVTLGASVTLTATISPAVATGPVTFKNGSVSLGTGTLSRGTATLTLAATTANGFAIGSDSITAVYAGDSNDSGSTSTAAILSVTEGTTTSVAANPYSIALGSSSATQSLTATVTTGSGTLTGTVTFKVGGATVGSAALSNGIATLSVAPTTANGFTVGSDTITATYNPISGSGFFASSGTQPLTVTAPAYTITPSTGTVPLSKGSSQSVTVTLASTTFADNTMWTATTSSPLITVSPSSGTATLSANGSSAVNLTITASSSAANHAPRLPWTGGLIAFGAVLAGVPLARRRKQVMAVLLTALAISTLWFLMSCGGGGGSSSTAPASPRSYTVTISGTGGVSSTIAVTVQ